MTWAYLDGIPLGPLALFAFGWLVFLVTVLTGFKARRPADRCTRCGSLWKRTERGGEFHLCTTPKGLREYP